MQNRKTTGMLFLVSLIAMMVVQIQATYADRHDAYVTLEKAAYFLTADEIEVLIEPGTYLLEANNPWIRLVSEEHKDGILLKATSIHHDENLSEPVVNVVFENDKQYVRLLFRGIQGFEIVGTVSDVRSRGVKRSRSAKSTTKRKTVSRRPMKKSTQIHSSGKTIQQLEKQVSDLQKIVHALQGRLSKLESAVQVSNSGITLNSSSKIKLNATTVEISSGAVNVNAGMSKFSGVVKSDTVIANSVVSASYTPGAGNIW